jgi:sodium ion-translocating decarboxylase beta subunit
MEFTSFIQTITQSLPAWGGKVIMMTVGAIFIYMAVVKEFEPNLLLPIGFGCIIANLGMDAYTPGGMFYYLYKAGIDTEIFPLLVYVGVGAMIDFTPLFTIPSMVFLGAAGQLGIYVTMILATLIFKDLNKAAAIGSIGTFDGPTAIFVSSKLSKDLMAPIAVAAYSYMSVVPFIQPPIMKLLTTKKERAVRMIYSAKPVPKKATIIFPIATTIIVSLIAPQAAPLIAAFMLGNLLKVVGVVDRLSKSAQNEIVNISTLLLGLTIGTTMTAEKFINWTSLGVLCLGFLAFVIDTASALLFGKLMYVITRGKFNPLIGACGISAFPMAGRISAKMALDTDPDNFIIMHAMGSNTAGQLGSVIAGGLLLTLISLIK